MSYSGFKFKSMLNIYDQERQYKQVVEHKNTGQNLYIHINCIIII